MHVSSLKIENPELIEEVRRLHIERPFTRVFYGDSKTKKALEKYPHSISLRWFWLSVCVCVPLIVVGLYAYTYTKYDALGLFTAFPALAFLFVGGLEMVEARNYQIERLNKLVYSLDKLRSYTGHELEEFKNLKNSEIQVIANRLMIEVVGPVFDLQESSVGANPLEWRPLHEELMKVVNERYDALKHLCLMPAGGYGLFFQHVRYERDGEPEKFILAT